MSAELAIALALLVFASNYACFRIGQQNILFRLRRRDERRRERESRWREFDDQD